MPKTDISGKFVIDINGKKYNTCKEIFDLIHSISLQRDYYKNIVELTNTIDERLKRKRKNFDC